LEIYTTGVLFGYFIILPFSLNFFINYKLDESIRNQIFIRDYVGYISMSTLSAGLMFEMPLVIFILAKIGVVGPKDLRKFRKYALLAIIILASISQVLIAVPVYILYELSIFVAALVYKKEKQKENEE